MRQLLCSLVGFFFVTTAFAQTRTWSGAGADDNWGTAANWGGTVPVAGNSIGFGGTNRLVNSNNLAADIGIAGIFFNAGAGEFVLSGNRITLTGNITQNDDSLQTINLDMILSGVRTFTQGTAGTPTAGGITVGGVLSGTGGIIKTSANTSTASHYNTLTLQATNTYTGATTVGSGTMLVNGLSGSIASSGSITVDNGFSFGSPVSTGGRLWLDNTAGNVNRLGDTATVTVRGFGQLQLTGNATADTTETIGQLIVGGGIAGSRGIVTLDGTAAGRLHTLEASTLVRSNNSTLLIRGTSLGQAATNATRVILASTANLPFVGSSVASGAVPGTTKDLRIVPWLLGDVTAGGNGTSFMTYDTVAGLRPLAASEYTVLTAGYTSAANTENVTGFNGTLTNASPTVNSLRFTGTATMAGTGTLAVNSGAVANLSSGAVNITGFSGLTLGNGTWNEGILTAQGNTLTISVPIDVTGGGGITKAGGSNVVLAAANVYTGETHIHQGQLIAAHDNALGSTSGRTVINGPEGGILGLQGNISIAEPLLLMGEGTSFSAILRNNSGTNNLNGLITVTGSTRISAASGSVMNINGGVVSLATSQLVINSSSTINFTGQPVILGAGGSFYMDSAGLTTLSSTGNFWSNTRVGSGSVMTNLRLDGENVLPEASLLSLGFGYAINGGVDLNGFNQTVSSLTTGTTGAGTRFITSATAATLTVNQNSASSFDAALTGAVALVKGGTAALTLQGTHTATGSTTVNNGTLILDYTAANTSKLADGASLTLGTATLQLDRTATPSGSHTEVVASTSVQGAANITRPGGTSTIQLNEITRQAGATLNIGTAGIATTDTLNNAAGMLGTWATVGGTDWAVNSTNGPDGAITAFTDYSNINRLGASAVPNTPGANVRIVNGGTSGNITLGAAVTDISTLNMSANAGSATLDPGTGEVLRLGADGAILHGTGAGALIIGTAANDGTLTAGGAPNTNGDLLIQRWSANDLTVNSTIANNGIGIVSVTIGGGTGTTRLTGTNTYTGRTRVSAGKLIIDAETALGANPDAFAADQLTLNGAILSTATVFTLDDSNRGITLGASGGTVETTSVANALALTVAVPIAGSGPLNKTGAGDAQLSVANSYTGHTYINVGRLRISNGAALGATSAGTTVASGAALRLEGAGLTLAEPLNLIGQGASSAGALQSNTSGNSTVSGLITMPSSSGGARITVTNTGRLFVTGGFRGPAAGTGDVLVVVGGVTFQDNPVNMFAGRLELVSGTNQPILAVAGNTYGVLNSGWGAQSQVTVDNALSPTGVLELGYHTTFSGSSPNTVFNLNATRQTASELRSGAISVGFGGYATPTRILTGTAGATLTLNQATNSLFDGAIQGAVSLVKNGNGILSLQANSTTTGDTVLNAGGIELRNAASTVQSGTVGTSSGSSSNFTTVITGLSNATTTLLVGQSITGAGIPAGSFIASIDSNSQVTIRSTAAATPGATSATFGVVPGALTNSTLDYQGGALSFGVTTTTTTLGGLKGDQNLALTNAGSNAVALTVGGNGQSTVYSGAISGSGSLIKAGTGTLELTGSSTHTGGVTVGNGVLLVNNINGSGTGLGPVSVATGATLGGNGIIGSTTASVTLTVDSGGVLRVGNTHGLTSGTASDLALQTSGLGTISLSGTVQFDLFSRQAGVNATSSNDVLRFTSSTAVILAGTLEVVNSTGTSTATWGFGDSWQLFDWSAVSPDPRHTGDFSILNLPTLNAGLIWDTSALFTTGFITITPEPGRALLLVAGLFSLALRRRRRLG